MHSKQLPGIGLAPKDSFKPSIDGCGPGTDWHIFHARCSTIYFGLLRTEVINSPYLGGYLQDLKEFRKVVVRERGLEPPRFLGHKILSLARLPVPPLPHSGLTH